MEFNQHSLEELHERAKETLVRYAEAPLGSEDEAEAALQLSEHTLDVQQKFEALHKMASIPSATIERCITGQYEGGNAAFLLGVNMLTVRSWFVTCYDNVTDTDYVDTLSATAEIALAYHGVRHIVIDTPNFTYVGLGVYGYDRLTINGNDRIYLTTLPLDGLQIVSREHQEN